MSIASDVRLNLVQTFEQAEAFMRWVGERHDGPLAFDCETSGLSAYQSDSRLRLFQVGDPLVGWAVPFHLWPGLVHEFFSRYDGPLVGHHAKFDVNWLRVNDVTVPWTRVDDTRLMAHVIEPRRSQALKSLAARLIDPQAAALQGALKSAMATNNWGWHDVPWDFNLYWAYGALDTVLTRRVHDALVPLLDVESKVVYELECEVQRVLAQMEHRGVRVDLAYTNTKRDELLTYAAQAEEWLAANHDVTSVNSRAQLIAALTKIGWEPRKTTATGLPSVDKEVLQSVDHPLASTVLSCRHARKMVSTYLDNLTSERVHCAINQLGAVTGRMSVSKPALQTLPRGRLIRDCFIASPNHTLVLADFDQIEARLLVAFADEEAMRQDMLTGDIHTATARRVYQDDTITKADPRRHTAKNAGFAKIYGAGVAKFAQTAGVTEGEAREFLEAYDRMYPGVRAFQDTVQRVALRRIAEDGVPWVRTPWGRRQVTDRGSEYKLVNYLIQGTAADVLKDRLVALNNAGLGEYMLLPVHDEVIFDVPTELVDEVSAAVRDVMELRDRFAVPLTIDIKVVNRWGDKYLDNGGEVVHEDS